jgi:hypothetical protein
MRLVLLLAVTISACTSGKKKDEAIVSLRNSYSPVQDMEVVVSAGVTLDQYSQRLTDALLKFKSSEDGCRRASTKFSDSNQQALAAGVCQHLGSAMDAYTMAKEYFGPKYDPSSGLEIRTLGEEDYAKAMERFPSLEVLEVAETNQFGYKFYYRSTMLQALWKVARQEADTAKSEMDQLSQK